MTATYNPAEVERLIAEAREDDARMLEAFREFGDSHLIRSKHGTAYGTYAVVAALERSAVMADHLEAARVAIENLEGMERAANAVRLAESQAMLRQERELDAAHAEIERLTGVARSRAEHARLLAGANVRLREEVDTARNILGASATEMLQQAAERVKVNCAERARERDAARAKVERMRPVFDASLAMRAADRGDAIRDEMSIAEAEAIAAENRSGRALMRWRNAVDAVLPNPNDRRDPSDDNTDEKG